MSKCSYVISLYFTIASQISTSFVSNVTILLIVPDSLAEFICFFLLSLRLSALYSTVILKNTGAIPFTAPVLSCTYFAATRCACLFPKQVAGYFVARSYFLQFRFLLQAAFRAVGATVAERTARRQIQRTGRFALDIFNLLGKVHLHVKDGIQQGP